MELDARAGAGRLDGVGGANNDTDDADRAWCASWCRTVFGGKAHQISEDVIRKIQGSWRDEGVWNRSLGLSTQKQDPHHRFPPFPNSSILQSWSSDSEQWCGIRCCCARKDLSLYGVFSGTKGMHEPSERKYVIMKSATFLIAKSTSGLLKKKITQRRIHPSIHQNNCL